MADYANYKPFTTPPGREPVTDVLTMKYDVPILKKGTSKQGKPYRFWSWGVTQVVKGVDTDMFWTLNSDNLLKMLLDEGACQGAMIEVALVQQAGSATKHWQLKHVGGNMRNKTQAAEVYAALLASENAPAQAQPAAQSNGNAAPQHQVTQPQRPAQQHQAPPPPAQGYGTNYNYPGMRWDNFEAMRKARADYFQMYEDAIVEGFDALVRAQSRIAEREDTPKTSFKLTIETARDLFAQAKEAAVSSMIQTIRTAEMKHGGLHLISVPEGEAPDTEEDLPLSKDEYEEEEIERVEGDIDLAEVVPVLYRSAVAGAKDGGEAMSKLTVDVQKMFPHWFGHTNHVKNVIKNKLGYAKTPVGDEAWQDLITEILVYEHARQSGMTEAQACVSVLEATGRPAELMPPIVESGKNEGASHQGEEEKEAYLGEEEPLF